MMKTIPGPQERPFLGSARTFAQDPPEELLRLAETYGEMVRFRLFTQTLYLVSSPELVREVLVTQAGSFPKWSRDVDLLSRFIGRGLVTSNGAYHQKQRQLVQPAFHTRRIAAYADTMVAYTAEMRAGWRDGETRDLSQEMVNLTMFIVGKTLFDADRAALSGRAGRILEASHALQAISDADFKSPIDWPEWLPTARNRRRKAERAVLDRLILGMIAERRAAAVDGRIHDTGDLLSMLLLAQDEAGAAMTDAQVRDELVTLFVAGHETTSNALTWTWYLLAQHPDVEARLHAEVDGVLNGRLPTLDDLKALPYTLMVLKEAMRLYPPAWVLNARQAAADVTLGDYHLPKGSVLFVSPYVMHRLSRLWPAPARFDPERFTPENEKQIPRYAYMPFGGGPRVCIGNSFALMEAHLILATLAQRFCFRLAGETAVATNPQVTMSPRGGLPVRVVAR